MAGDPGMLGRIARLARTVRHLKPAQIVGRLRFRLARPRPDLSPAPGLRDQRAEAIAPAHAEPSMTGPDRFDFLNETRSFASVGWDDPDVPKLWRYNLHYFADLNAANAGERHAWHTGLIARWIAENPPASGSGWEPYPTSLRIVNWVKYAHGGAQLDEAAYHSLAVQARWLMQRLEWHLLGNHLFVNAKALIFAGCYFEGAEADSWLRRGISILDEELGEQVLPDGGQFELSPMYHALLVEDLLDLLALQRVYDAAMLEPLARRIAALVPATLDWLATMSHPDGRIAFFNDAAFGIAPENDELLAYAERLGFARPNDPGTTWLKSSGYLRMVAGDAVALVDLAEIGPEYLPGHAHADTFSFELSLGGQRIFVNSGTSLYGTGPERQRQRGTAAHNTVTVAGENSSEVWSGFRVGRRARPNVIEMSLEDAIVVAAEHDGYRHLAGAPIHERRLLLEDRHLRIEDRISAPLPATARLHLHPTIETEIDGNSATLRGPGGIVIVIEAGGPILAEASTWHPAFGQTEENLCLAVDVVGSDNFLSIKW